MSDLSIGVQVRTYVLPTRLTQPVCHSTAYRLLPFLSSSVWLERKAARLDLEKKQERRKAKAMEDELSWIRQGPKVRMWWRWWRRGARCVRRECRKACLRLR